MTDPAPEKLSDLGGLQITEARSLLSHLNEEQMSQLTQLIASQPAQPLHTNVDYPWVDGDPNNEGQTYGRRICDAMARNNAKKVEVWGFDRVGESGPAKTREWLATYGVALTQDQRTEPNWDGVPLTHRFWVATWDGKTALPK